MFELGLPFVDEGIDTFFLVVRVEDANEETAFVLDS